MFLLGSWGGPLVALRPGKGGGGEADDETPPGALLVEDPELTEPVRVGGGGRDVNAVGLLAELALGGGGGGTPDGSQLVFFIGTLASFMRRQSTSGFVENGLPGIAISDILQFLNSRASCFRCFGLDISNYRSIISVQGTAMNV